MRNSLKRVDPGRQRGWLYRAYTRFVNTALGRFLSVRVVWKLDPILMRASGGQIGLGGPLPTALLETTGARSGEPRCNAVLYFHDGERVTIIASKLGLSEHPAWFHNLRANPKVMLGGLPMRAAVVSDAAERRRLWALADNVFPPYAAYRERAGRSGREIPIVQLTQR